MRILEAEKAVNNFNATFRTDQWVEVFGSNNGVGQVQAPAELVEGCPLVSIEGVGLVNLFRNEVREQVGAQQGIPASDYTPLDMETAELEDDADGGGIPLENTIPDDEPVQFGGGDFGGGGSSDSFETPDDQQDDDWEGDESEGEDSSDDSDNSSDDE
jgi:hypothetical protein